MGNLPKAWWKLWHEFIQGWCDTDGFYEFLPVTPRAQTRFWTQAFPFTELGLLQTASVVDITYKSDSIYVILQSAQNFVPSEDPPQTCSFQDLYRDLSPELQRVIGHVEWPELPALIAIAKSVQDGTVLGVSDRSARASAHRSTQAWIIQAPNGSEINRYGPV